MIRKLLLAAVGVFALGSMVMLAVLAAGYALFLSLKGSVGEAWAAGIVALVFALVIAIVALLAGIKEQPHHQDSHDGEPHLMDFLGRLVREKPMLAAGGALAAGLIALRNPQIVATLVSAFLASKATEKTDRRR